MGAGHGRPAGARGRKPGPKKGARRSTRKRAKNKITLPDALVAAVRKGSTVSPADAGKAVKAKGYKTTSKTFGVQVASALAKDKRFKKVGRGQYQLIGGGGAAPAKPKKARKARKPRKANKKAAKPKRARKPRKAAKKAVTRKTKKVRRRRRKVATKGTASAAAQAA